MKTITLLIYLFPIIIFSQSAYTKGYNEGFKKGYCYNQPLGCVAPLPYLPTASIKTSFEEGYNDGFIKGTERKQSETTQSNTTPYFPKYEQNQSYSNSETSVYGINLYNTVKEKTNFSVAGAYYPETHMENNDLMDLFNLKTKVESGTDFLISQIFFDNEILYRFKEKTDKLGINIPFAAGIIPVTNAKQIKRITSLCGCSLPPKFKRILDKYEDKPEALMEAGIAYAIEQIIDLISWGIDGIHLYTMNKIDTTKKIMENIEHIREI